MIIEESIECRSCGLMWMVPIKARIIHCPKCNHRMLKIFEIKFCQCGHENISHKGFDEYGAIRECTKCICPRFELTNDSKQFFIKKYFVTILNETEKRIIKFLKDKKREWM